MLKMLAYWPLGIWVVGMMLVGYLIFRKIMTRRLFVMALVCCALIYSLSWWVHSAEMNVPILSEATPAGAQTRSLDVLLQASICMMISFYGFLSAAGIWIGHETVRLATRRNIPAAVQ